MEPIADLEDHDTIDEILDEERCDKEYFPLPFLLFFVGYLIILIVDRVILRHGHGDLLGHSHGHSHGHDHNIKDDHEHAY